MTKTGLVRYFRGLLLALFAWGGAAQAGTPTPPVLDLSLANAPDIFSSFINTSYTASSDVFTAAGFASTIDPDGSGAIGIVGGTFDIIAAISDIGVASSGLLTIGGTVASLGFNSGTLLTGTLVTEAAAQARGFTSNFGTSPSNTDPLAFIFDVTGGDALGLYTAVDPWVGVILNETGYVGDFFGDFRSAPFAGVADTAPVPLPAAAWLFGSALLGLLGMARRRKLSPRA